MSLKLKKYGLMIIAAVLLVAMAFAGAASADATNTTIGNWAELNQNITNWNTHSDGGMLTIIISGFDSSDADGNVDIQVTSNVTIMPAASRGESVLDAKQKGRIFTVGNNGMWSSTPGNLTLKGNTGSTLNMTGGYVKGDDNNNACGGGIEINVGNVILEHGAKLTNCTCDIYTTETKYATGGGIDIKIGTFTMYGGEISDCRAIRSGISGICQGGGIYINSGTFTMNSGNITRCCSDGDGGGVYNFNENFFINGGNITGCIAEYDGGGICGSAIMTGGNITGCSAGGNGGGIYSNVGTIYINNTALVDANNDVFVGDVIQLGSGGLKSDSYGIKNISVDSPSIDKVVVVNGASNASCFGLSSALSYVLKAGTESGHENDLVLGEPEPYGINITTSDGTYVMSEALSTIHGDGKTAANGTATVVKNSEGNFTLTLNNFNASNMSNVPIIDASVPNLTIKLVGDSNLTGSFANSDKGLVYSSGNLTITNSGKLLVNNNKTDGYVVYTICADEGNLTIEGGAHVIAKAQGNEVALALSSSDTLSITGQHTIVEANTTASIYDAISIQSKNILIDSYANVISNATASGSEYATAYSLYGHKSIEINSSAQVTANGNAPSGSAYSICIMMSGKSNDEGNPDIMITNANVHANALGNGETSAIYSGRGNLTVSGDDAVVEANATSSGGDVYAVYASKESTIDGSTVTAKAKTTGDGKKAYGLYSDKGDVSITNDADVNVKATTTGDKITDPSYVYPDSYAIYASNGNIIIENGSCLDANATCDHGFYPSALYAVKGGITITNSSDVTADTIVRVGTQRVFALYAANTGDIVVSDSSRLKTNVTAFSVGSWFMSDICANNGNISISGLSDITATATSFGNPGIACSLSTGDFESYADGKDITITDSNITIVADGMSEASAIRSYGGNITITGTTTIIDAKANASNGDAKTIASGNTEYGKDITINNATVIAKAEGSGQGYAIWTGDDSGGNVTIAGNDTIVEASAIGNGEMDMNTFAIYAGKDLNIASAKKILANASGQTSFVSSFGYSGSRNLDGLKTGYSFANATYPGEEPKSYDMFSNGWKPGMMTEISNYTSVLIAKSTRISLNPNGGAGGTTSVTATYDNATLNTSISNPVLNGHTLTGWFTQQNGGTEVITATGSLKSGVTGYTDASGKWTNTSNAVELFAHWQQNAAPYTPSHHETGQTVIQQQAPVQDVSTDPTPANQQTADISAKYVAQTVIGTSTADTAALKQQYPEAAAQFEVAFATAQAAGISLTNSKGAQALIMTSENIPNVEKVTFSRVYEISPANEGEKLTKVTVKVPKTDITAKGLTSEDVTIYHYLDTYNIWVPLETLSVSQDDSNYYYTAATDGTSPFGVLVKKIGDDSTAVPTTKPTQSSPAPFLGLLAGLGAAALVLVRLRK